MTRTLWLVFAAMVMFAAGVVVLATGETRGERILAGVAILGSLAVVVANVGNGKGPPDRRDYSRDREPW